MTDREMLELAAKAAGLTVEWREWVTSRVAEFGVFKYTKQSGFWLDGKQWNPLIGDADALRLAVRLSLVVEPGTCWITKFGPVFREDVLPDPYAATRRAIVRAAAEAGRSME